MRFRNDLSFFDDDILVATSFHDLENHVSFQLVEQLKRTISQEQLNNSNEYNTLSGIILLNECMIKQVVPRAECNCNWNQNIMKRHSERSVVLPTRAIAISDKKESFQALSELKRMDKGVLAAGPEEDNCSSTGKQTQNFWTGP